MSRVYTRRRGAALCTLTKVIYTNAATTRLHIRVTDTKNRSSTRWIKVNAVGDIRAGVVYFRFAGLSARRSGCRRVYTIYRHILVTTMFATMVYRFVE